MTTTGFSTPERTAGGSGVNIETNYGKRRTCENTKGAGTWVECKFDHRENGCVRWQACEYDGDTGKYYNVSKWSEWVLIDIGIQDNGYC